VGGAASNEQDAFTDFRADNGYDASYGNFLTGTDSERLNRNDLPETAGRQDRDPWLREQQNSAQAPTIRPPAGYDPNLRGTVPGYPSGTTTNAQRSRQRMTAHVASGAGLENTDPRTTVPLTDMGTEAQPRYTMPVSNGAASDTLGMRPPIATGTPTATDPASNAPITSGGLPRSGSLDPYQPNSTTTGLPPELEQAKSEEQGTKAGSYFFTLLALFASLGMNLYLGWIAWDTYNRYQDLVADMRQSSSRRDRDRDRDDRDSAPRRNRRLAEAY
jgi:hypothetical protein